MANLILVVAPSKMQSQTCQMLSWTRRTGIARVMACKLWDFPYSNSPVWTFHLHHNWHKAAGFHNYQQKVVNLDCKIPHLMIAWTYFAVLLLTFPFLFFCANKTQNTVNVCYYLFYPAAIITRDNFSFNIIKSSQIKSYLFEIDFR